LSFLFLLLLYFSLSSADRLPAFGNVDAERLVLEYGRPFNGIPRPKGYRQRSQKRCFANAQILADTDRGIYCEGFAIAPESGPAFQHGWITLDGANAIDVTLQAAHEVKYFGIPFEHEPLKKLIRKITTEEKAWVPLLSPPIDRRVIDALKTLRADGLFCNKFRCNHEPVGRSQQSGQGCSKTQCRIM
jgi:hypothetical protein